MIGETTLACSFNCFGRIISVIFCLLIGFAAQNAAGQNAEAKPSPELSVLEQGKAIERELAGGQKHSYQINLPAAQFISVKVAQRGVDVLVRLHGPDGKALADFDAEMRPTQAELIEFAAEEAGLYRLDVEPRFKRLPTGKYEILWEQARPASEKDKLLQEARDAYAESLRQLGAGKYAEAKPLVERAVEIRQTELGAENPLTAMALTLLARILDAQGKYDQAVELNQRVLAVREKILGADHPDVGYTLNYLALIYNRQADFQKAVSFHERALSVRQKVFGPEHPIVASSLINLGVVYDSLGDKVKAGELYERALKIQEQAVGTENLNGAVILNNIGKLYNDLEEYQKAQPFLLRAVATLEKLYAPDNPRIADALTNLAENYAEQGDLEKAEPIYLRILSSREKTPGPNHPLTAHVLYNLANLYFYKNDLEKAGALYQRALSIRENALGPENPGVAEVLTGLSLIAAKKGALAEAVALERRAARINERNISLNLGIGSERQKIAYLQSIVEQTNQNIFIQTRFAADNAEAVELAATTVLRQKGRVMDAVSNDLVELRRRFNAQDRSLLDRLSETKTLLAELILSGPGEGVALADHQAEIKRLTEVQEKLENEISQRAAGFFIKSEPFDLASIRALIPAGAALIEFVVFSPAAFDSNNSAKPDQAQYIAYVIEKDGQVKWKNLGEAARIDRAVDAFRQALREPQRKDVKTLARALDSLVMQPLRAVLKDPAQILISPDGALNLVPFEALVDEQDRYLIERFAFSYLTSGRDLLRLKAARESRSKSLVIADPSFGQPLSEDASMAATAKLKTRNGKRSSVTATRDISEVYFAPLGGTVREARSIRNFFPEADFLSGAQASETALKQTIAPRVLHIATHGFFLEDVSVSKNKNLKIENPLLRSGLALAGANRRDKLAPDDGILTALEASGLNLWGTKLVVLSACDTGLGEIKNGEGVYGLRRAFVLAGTESMVMSLWAVRDYVTSELMSGYYKNLKSGEGRGAALRSVQLEMLGRADRAHPFFWAGFIQSGEWAPLDVKR